MWIKYISAAVLVLLVVARLFSRSQTAAFGNLGLLTGLALGLSASPVLAATVSAIFTLAGVLVPLYVRPPAAADESPTGRSANARLWLGPLAGWLAVGLIIGIFLRANDALNFSNNLRSRYAEQGFTPTQIESIMNGHATSLAKQPPALTLAQDKTNLQSNPRAEKWARLLEDLVRPDEPPEKNLERVKKAVTPEDRERIQWLETRGATPTQILEILKSWHSGKEPDPADR